ENNMAGTKMGILAAQEGLADDDVAAAIGNEAEDGAVGSGEAVGAPVVTEQIPLVAPGKSGSVIAQELRMGAAHVLEAGRRQRVLAGKARVSDVAPAVTMIVHTVEHAHEAVGIAFAVAQEPELAKGVVLE